MTIKHPVEERLWAVLAHLSPLAMGMGLFLPILGWSESRRKSNYTSFQCMQALGYQTLGYTVWMLTTLLLLMVSSVSFIFGMQTVDSLSANLNAWVIGHSILMFGLMALYFALPIIAAVSCAFGKDFLYPFMGKRLARYLGYDPIHSNKEGNWLIEENEDRWVAAMGHFVVIIVFWGLTAPIISWILQGKRSLFLKFQSVQTVVFQAGTMLLYLLAGLLSMFGLIVFIITIGFEGNIDLNSSGGMIGAIVFLVSLLIALLIFLIVPFLHILGQWAGYRVLKGDEYRYPLVGKFVEKWIS